MSDSTVRVVSWNMAHKQESWRHLPDMECGLALLQETCRPPDEIAGKVEVDPAPWPAAERDSRVKWRSAIAVLSDRVAVEWLSAEPLGRAAYGHLAVSSPGTLAAARVQPRAGKSFAAVFMHAELESPIEGEGRWIFTDSSAHRLVSDLGRLLYETRWGFADLEHHSGSPHRPAMFRSTQAVIAAQGSASAGSRMQDKSPSGICGPVYSNCLSLHACMEGARLPGASLICFSCPIPMSPKEPLNPVGGAVFSNCLASASRRSWVLGRQSSVLPDFSLKHGRT